METPQSESSTSSQLQGTAEPAPQRWREVRIPLPRMAAVWSGISRAELLSFLALLGLGAAGLGVWRLTRRLDALATLTFEQLSTTASLTARADSLAGRVALLELKGGPTYVDLRAASLQPIGQGFEVGHLQVHSEPGGLRLTGLVLNTQAVGHKSADFKVAVEGSEREFMVMSLPPGTSGTFSVSVPGVRADSALYGTIEFENSTVSYSQGR